MRRKSIAVIAAALMVMVAVMAGFTGCGDKSAKSDKVIKIGLVQLVEHTSDQIRESIIDELKKKGMLMVKILKSTIRMHRMNSPIWKTICRGFVADDVDLIIAITTPQHRWP